MANAQMDENRMRNKTRAVSFEQPPVVVVSAAHPPHLNHYHHPHQNWCEYSISIDETKSDSSHHIHQSYHLNQRQQPNSLVTSDPSCSSTAVCSGASKPCATTDDGDEFMDTSPPPTLFKPPRV